MRNLIWSLGTLAAVIAICVAGLSRLSTVDDGEAPAGADTADLRANAESSSHVVAVPG